MTGTFQLRGEHKYSSLYIFRIEAKMKMDKNIIDVHIHIEPLLD